VSRGLGPFFREKLHAECKFFKKTAGIFAIIRRLRGMRMTLRPQQLM